MKTDHLEIAAGPAGRMVSALHVTAPQAHTLFVLAHGAGANMQHSFMQRLAEALAAAGVASLRYNFPYMEAGGRRPDPPALLETTVRAAIDAAFELSPGSRIIAGGKSMGGRMTSQALAQQPDGRVRGVAFVGFPLHQPGRPGTDRAVHLAHVQTPMLFLQGTRDTLARIDLITDVCTALGTRATLHVVDQADHSFAVPKRTGKSADAVHQELAVSIAEWAVRI